METVKLAKLTPQIPTTSAIVNANLNANLNVNNEDITEDQQQQLEKELPIAIESTDFSIPFTQLNN